MKLLQNPGRKSWHLANILDGAIPQPIKGSSQRQLNANPGCLLSMVGKARSKDILMLMSLYKDSSSKLQVTQLYEVLYIRCYTVKYYT